MLIKCCGQDCCERNDCWRYRSVPTLEQEWAPYDTRRGPILCQHKIPLDRLQDHGPLHPDDWLEIGNELGHPTDD